MEKRLLAAIVSTAFVTRAIAIWLMRPEFMGWFNHSYYYWVQVKGVLQSGQLPYADLPLVFYFYSGIARVFQLFGQEPHPSIINSARLVMSAAPALIAIPIYLIARRINANGPLTRSQWILVGVSAFLPLTFVHMPEMFQKNMLGLLLFITFMFAAFELLCRRTVIWFVGTVALFLLITVTHLGTLAVALLYCLSILLAFLYNKTDIRQLITLLLVIGGFSITSLGAVYYLDTDAFARIVGYAQSSLPNSMMGRLFSSESVEQALLFLTGILIPIAVTLSLVRVYWLYREALLPADRILWLGSIILAYLLVLPIIDLDIVPRLLLFTPLPLLIVLNFQLRYHRGQRINLILVSVATLGVSTMLLGEVSSLVRLYPNKADIYDELLNLKTQYQFSERDFVLTTYGVNPICNWFLDSKSGLITSFNRNDRASYDRLFVLNTMERRPGHGTDNSQQTFLTASERYDAMRQDILLPPDLAPDSDYEQLEFYELEHVPVNWLFDSRGNWIGWKY